MMVGYRAPWRDKTTATVTSQPSGVDESISDGTEKNEEYWPQSLEMSLQLPSYSHPEVKVLDRTSV